MTVDEIYDNVKRNSIPVGLDAWMPGKITTGDEEETAWREYIPSWKKSTNPWSSESFDSLRQKLAYDLYGPSLSRNEAEAFFKQAEKEQAEKEQKEKEALEHAKMYFG